jgi:hypothetical protein
MPLDTPAADLAMTKQESRAQNLKWQSAQNEEERLKDPTQQQHWTKQIVRHEYVYGGECVGRQICWRWDALSLDGRWRQDAG